MPRQRPVPPPISRDDFEAVRDQFIAAWGQMGPAWGVSRTMAEVFALLFITSEPLNTDQVMGRLRISRGNASMSLRSLVEWGLVARVHRRGDRKEYFQAESDVWALSRKVIRERLRREIHPLLTTLHEVRDRTHQPIGLVRFTPSSDVHETDRPVTQSELDAHNRRLDDMLELIQTIDRLAERFVGAEGKGLRVAASLLSKLV
ncbi:MAG: hypothetical protein KF768_00815 [Phycisphaeraceae bacterium]|nr:hypothetical protein [Phycisphaeraceae bacterium]